MMGIPKQDAKRFLADVPEEYVFWCFNGHILRNMQELAEALNTMTDETFAYHSNAQKNDFSNWVRDIIRDDELASGLMKASSRTKAAKVVSERIASFTKSGKPLKNTSPSKTRSSTSPRR
jgi:hypothetical protein